VYDCANESRPGVTSALLSPPQALHYLQAVMKKDPRISVVGIAGPGDPFATPAETIETLRLVREHYAEMLLCVASNGLAIGPHIDALAALRVSHVTLTINAVDPEIGSQIYSWIRDGKRMYRGVLGAQVLWERQSEAIRRLKERDITVKINMIAIPGVNDLHIPEVARTVAALGADIANCIPLFPVEGTLFAAIPSPSAEQVSAMREAISEHLPIMTHCTRCRADAVGLLGDAMPAHAEVALLQAASWSSPSLSPSMETESLESRPYVAVATMEGVLVNQHLGEVERLAIFCKDATGFRLVETRRTPPSGGGTQRWVDLAESIKDCRALLVANAGDAPRTVLNENGVKIVLMEGLIEEGLDAVYRGLELRSPLRKQHRCGSGCGGNGQGCM
jgi:nitrogen fixation protein NifB